MKMNCNTKKNDCAYQICIGGFYCCKLVADRQKAINEKNDDVKYGGAIVNLDDRCIKKRGCGYKKKTI